MPPGPAAAAAVPLLASGARPPGPTMRSSRAVHDPPIDFLLALAYGPKKGAGPRRCGVSFLGPGTGPGPKFIMAGHMGIKGIGNSKGPRRDQ